jgi:nucleoside-diphosphate-sugar epimerase
MEKRKILVVGFEGGVGRAVAKALRAKGEPVVAFAPDEKTAKPRAEGIEGLEFAYGDPANPKDIDRAAEGVGRIFYCVVLPMDKWAEKAFSTMKPSLDAAVKQNAKFVLASNVYVYGKPQFVPIREGHPHVTQARMGGAYVNMERAIRAAGLMNALRWTIVRFPDRYGPFTMNCLHDQNFKNAANGKKIRWFGRPDVLTEFIYIEDAGEAMATAGLADVADGMEFNVSGPEPIYARDFVDILVESSGKNSAVKFLKHQWQVCIQGLFRKKMCHLVEVHYLKQLSMIMDGDNYRSFFGELPATPYREGTRKTVEWIRSQKLK